MNIHRDLAQITWILAHYEVKSLVLWTLS